MMNEESFLIKPFTSPCKATVKLPGSKSISNRALILSVMCNAEVELKGILESEDVDLMKVALRLLGIRIEEIQNGVKVFGTGGIIPEKKAKINVGNAGTIARFLTCLLGSQKDAEFYMDGTEAMRERPMIELLNCLEKQGCKIKYHQKNGHFPFTLYTSNIWNKIIEIDGKKSGQNISGVLMQCLKEYKNCTVEFSKGTVSVPFIEMTLKMMQQFSDNESLEYSFRDNAIQVSQSFYKKNNFCYNIEPDATAASYFLTLPLVVGGRCEVLGVGKEMLQGDVAYCDVLQQIGADIVFEKDRIVSKPHNGLRGGIYDFIDISDTFLTLAAISPLLGKPIEIHGIEHTRKQETDRVSAMAQELVKLGQNVVEKHDRLIISPNLNKLMMLAKESIAIETYKDHRFAMSFGILGSFNLLGNGKPWLKIKDPKCCAKTFPSFFDCLNTAHASSHV